jgi:hypothetical protein
MTSPFWKPEWSTPAEPFEWKGSDLEDTRDMRDPVVLGHRLFKLRDSEELKAKYPLSQVYDHFFSS